MNNPNQELQHLQALLLLEKEEDQRLYSEKIKKNPLSERKKMGFCWYPVVLLESGTGQVKKLVAEFERTSQVDEPHHFQFGKPVVLFSNNAAAKEQPHISGIITTVKPNKLRIAFNTDEFPDWIDDGKLGIDLEFDEISYREMDFALKKVISAEKNRLAELKEILLGAKKAVFNTNKHFINYPELNDSQNEALQLIDSAQDVAIIHGPPGTGKTTTLVKAITQTLKTEEQVLVCAPSNTAVDLLTEKLSSLGINVVRIGNPARVSENLYRLTLDSRSAEHPEHKELKRLRKSAQEYRKLAQKYKRHFGFAEREQRRLIMAEARKIEADAEQIENYIVADVLDKAQVVASTLVGAAHYLLRDKTYKTVFIDEAGQALEPASWIPVTRAQKVVFAGDHQQLPPTVKSRKAEKEGLNITLFEKCLERQQADVMLRTQYRMHEDIMSFSNNYFYKGKLVAHDSVKDAVLKTESEEVLASPLEFIDTAGCGFNEVFEKENVSLYNPEEASLLFRHLENLLFTIENNQPELITLEFSIGIISPYKAQVEYLKTQLQNQELVLRYKNHITINTVDGFQGQERDIMYISMVRSNDTGEIGFLNDFRRMNVALTRARKKMVIIGDSATLCYHAFYKEFMDFTEKAEAYKSAWEFG